MRLYLRCLADKMEWLKKHWGWIAAIAVGIPVLYWLYQTYQTNAANNAQNAQQTDLQNQEEADAASYAQQIALGNLSGGIGSSSSGVASEPVTSTVSGTQTSATPIASTSTPIASTSTGVSSPANLYAGTVGATGETFAPPTASNTYEPAGFQTAQSPVPSTGNNTPAKSQTYGTVTTLLGTGAAAIQQNQTAPPRAPVTTTPPAHITSGSIEQHNNILPSSPTSKELSSISPGRG